MGIKRGLKSFQGSNPGTVSRVLWHFTGGPKWNDKLQRQENRPKEEKLAFEALCSILKDRTLRVGGYHECINVVLPEATIFDEKKKAFVKKKKHRLSIPTEKVCCVADIPIQHLGYHSTRYGKMAIGFHREAIVRAKFNPVLYTLSTEDLVGSLYGAIATLNSVDSGDLLDAAEAMGDNACLELTCPECDNEINLEDDAHFETADVESAVDEMLTLSETALEGTKLIASFVKTFDLSEFGTIYCEREWRSISPFKFTWSDVAMILLPRESDFLKKFHSKNQTFPKTIPVIAWEDVVEQ